MKISLTVTKHLHEENRWRNYAQLFLHDLNHVESQSRIHLQRMNTLLFLYQTFEIFVMFKMKMFMKEEFNVNDMSLEKINMNVSKIKNEACEFINKTIKMLELICLNRLLHIAHDEINDAHYEKKFNEHLKEDILSTFQSKDAKCSFDNKLKIKCSCVNANSSAHFISSKFVNLVIISSVLITNWLKKIWIHLDKNNDLLRWQIHYAYYDAKMNALVIRLTWTDKDFLVEQE